MLQEVDKKARSRSDNKAGDSYIPKVVFAVFSAASILVIFQSFFSTFNQQTLLILGLNASLYVALFFLKNKSYDVSKHYIIFITSLIIIFDIYLYGIMAGALHLMIPLVISEILFWRSKRKIYIIYHSAIFLLVLVFVWLDSNSNSLELFEQNQLHFLNIIALLNTILISSFLVYVITKRHDDIEEKHYKNSTDINSVFSSILDGILTIDKTGKIVHVKSKKNSFSSLLGHNVFNLLDIENSKILKSNRNSTAASGNFSNRINIKTDQLHSDLFIYATDEEQCILVGYTDSENLYNDQEFISLKHEYQTIIDSDNRGIIIFDYNLNTQVFNSKAQILCGSICNKNEYPSIKKLFAKFNSISIESVIEQTKRGNIIYKEVIVEDTGIPKIYLAIEFIPIINDYKKTSNILVTISDITQNKKLEIDTKEAKNEAEKLSAIIDQTEISIAIINSNADVNYCNPAFKKKHWNKNTKENNTNIFDLLPSNGKIDNDINFIKTCISIGNGCQVQLPINSSKNYTYIATFIMQPLQVINGERHFSVILQDMSMQIERENQLKRAKDYAEKASKMKTNFLSNISHEIRTPLNAIIGLTDLMLTDNEVEKNLNSLSLIKSSSSNLLAVMNTLLDYSRIETGKIVIDRSEFDLKPLLDDIIRLFKQTAEKKGIALNIIFDSSIPNTLIGDAYRISQVISNLLSNAIKFTETGGAVTVSVNKIEKLAQSLKIGFEVIDTGIGIKEEDKADIFLSFSKIQANTYSNSGTGVGLAMIKSLLDLMGSTISLKSEYGKGSIFSFTLNLGIKEVIVSKDNSSSQKQLISTFEDLCVLLVEDNVVNQFVALQLLKKWNIKAKTALNGAIAIEMLLQGSYDIILMDIQMPVMNGLECTEKIRKGELGEKLKTIPIVALSADVFPETRERAFQLGFNFFLNKPIKHDELLSVINSFSEKKKETITTKPLSTNKSNTANTMLNIDFIKENISDEPEFIKEVLEVFIATNQSDFEILANNLNERDALSIKKSAHKLKSSFKSLGILSTGAKLEQIERLALANTIDGISDILNEVEQDINTIKEEVLNYL